MHELTLDDLSLLNFVKLEFLITNIIKFKIVKSHLRLLCENIS